MLCSGGLLVGLKHTELFRFLHSAYFQVQNFFGSLQENVNML